MMRMPLKYYEELDDWDAQALGELSGFCMGRIRPKEGDTHVAYLVACDRCGFAVTRLADHAMFVHAKFDVEASIEAEALEAFRKEAAFRGCHHERDAAFYLKEHRQALDVIAMMKLVAWQRSQGML